MVSSTIVTKATVPTQAATKTNQDETGSNRRKRFHGSTRCSGVTSRVNAEFPETPRPFAEEGSQIQFRA
jgi:hypothetical protein